MSKTMKKVSALLLALLMILSFMPMTQESAYAAAKKPGKVKNLKVKVSGKKMTISWKKAKNAKKYSVSIKDNSTKLTATKSTKKTKLKITGQYGTSYKITVKAVNGKTKGKGVSKKAKTAADPNKVSKSEYEKVEAEKKQAEDDLQKAQDAYEELWKKENVTEKELEQAQKNLDKASAQYDALDKEMREALASATELNHPDWNPEVKDALNKMIEANAWKANKYVVFDYDNTCSIFDVEEQLAVYQLQVMAFDETVDAEKLAEILATGLNPDYFVEPAPASGDYCENANATYQDWINDITAAYSKLLAKYGQFKPAGLSEEKQIEIQQDDDWKEFATKMRAMYDCVFDSESADVAYPWVLYWFTGMSHDEVYNLAYASHDKYRKLPSTEETWTTAGTDTAIGAVSYTWTSGTQVSENIVELMAALHNNGIKVWVCSASATDPIRAAIDVFGQHNVVDGMMAMTNVYENGAYVNKYDYDTGYACIPVEIDGDPKSADWTYGTDATKAQTQGVGKSIAVQNVLGPQYAGNGPIAGFMDSTGDFNFCTEFKDLQVVCCFNRASRKTTDGGGLIAELAVYEADDLEYDYDKAMAAGDTLYVLQGRDENGFRGLLPKRETHTLGSTTDKLWRDKESDSTNPNVTGNYKGNTLQYTYIKEHKMTVEAAINRFAMKTAWDAEGNDYGYKYGFLKTYEGYHSKEGTDVSDIDKAKALSLETWNPEVKDAINSMIAANKGRENKYVVFDFDNTCSIFDVEEQLAVYQLQVMAFDETVTVDKLKDILATELNPKYFTEPAPASGDYCENANATYQDWIDDIAAAYDKLLQKYGPFKPAGLTEAEQAVVQADDDWKEFATKMRAMYDCVFDSESAAVAYPWVLYWFTGMSHDEVYALAAASHTKYKAVETSEVEWSTDVAGSKIGKVSYTWTSGTAVSENINELMAALDNNGIDVWVCSASATDPIRAAIDVWGLHDHVTGMMAMTNVYKDNAFENAYDYETGCAWIPKENGEWEEGTVPTKAQTQGKGKVTAIQNVCGSKYGCGPIAGFMDSTGDYNFCTEFEDLEVVCCFNRATRKVTDGGGLIAEMAVYQADTLYKDEDDNYEAALEYGDTLYVLQGREENGLRGLRPARETMRLGKTEPILFRNDDNYTQLEYMIDNKMKVADALDLFAIKRAAGEVGNPFEFKIGFLSEYSGYHSQGAEDMGLLKHKDWNPEVKRALNSMIKAEANNGKYVVFDFDNTCSIFDVEEQLAIFQLQTMAFDETVDAAKLEDILKTELNPEYFTKPAPASGDYCANKDATYQDWIDDITAAFAELDKDYDFTPAGLTPDQQVAIQKTAQWKEFATKMRAMYDCVFDSESAAVAYPWVLYWFTGMTEDEVYELAYRSHDFYRQEESKYVTWETDLLGSKCGSCSYEFTWGTAVSDNIVELWKALDENGIDVWVCSASATDPIRAAIDVWGGHEYITGMMAMTNKLDADGHYINEYDWDGGYAWKPVPPLGAKNHGWVKDDVKQKTQTQGKGKVIAIQHVLYPKYGNEGPIAGFMDSTGDYNFCTEFETLQVVACFNRASRKVTDGGGVIAELAVYQADELGMDYDVARSVGDTLYVLQGREENGLRGFRPQRETLRLGKTEPLLFRGADNFTELEKMADTYMSTQEVVDDFALVTPAGDRKYGFKFKYGFVYGQPGEGLGPKFYDEEYNPDSLDFSGYHSQA